MWGSFGLSLSSFSLTDSMDGVLYVGERSLKEEESRVFVRICMDLYHFRE